MHFTFQASASVALEGHFHVTAGPVDAYLRDGDSHVRLWSLGNAQTLPDSDGARIAPFSSTL